MKQTIWKYEIEIKDHFQITMPEGAWCLDVQMQGSVPYMWVLVDEDNKRETRYFRIIGTGHSIKENLGPHIATFQIGQYGLVFHVFEYFPVPTQDEQT